MNTLSVSLQHSILTLAAGKRSQRDIAKLLGIHGTTRRQVGKVFHEVERTTLLPLPAGLFPVFEEAPRTVHQDGYVELKRAYYTSSRAC